MCYDICYDYWMCSMCFVIGYICTGWEIIELTTGLEIVFITQGFGCVIESVCTDLEIIVLVDVCYGMRKVQGRSGNTHRWCVTGCVYCTDLEVIGLADVCYLMCRYKYGNIII